MKCWKCQNEMINTIGGNYYCPNCDFSLHDLVYRGFPINSFPQEEIVPYQYGWICPKCGRVYAPGTVMCSFCGNGSYTITYGTGIGTIGGSIPEVDIKGSTTSDGAITKVNTETNKPFKGAGVKADSLSWVEDNHLSIEEFENIKKGAK